jgi:tetratricopeptide (TPR) repeat protein
LFEEAIRLDPGFARAHAGLADVHSLRVDYGLVPPGEGLPDARRAADEALRLGAGLAEAHPSAALVRQLEGAWHEARDGLERALELNPGYEVARHRYALLLAWLGHTDEARRQIEVARKLDPLSPVVTATVGWIEYYAGDFAVSAAAAREALAADPGLVTVRVVLALSLVAAGHPEAAADELRGALARGEGGGVRALLVHALGRAGRDARAAVELDRLRDGNGGYVSPYCLAVALLGTGNREGALAALDRAVATGTPQVVYLREDPLFDVLRSDRRFRAFLVRADLVHPLRSGEDARRSGAAT